MQGKKRNTISNKKRNIMWMENLSQKIYYERFFQKGWGVVKENSWTWVFWL